MRSSVRLACCFVLAFGAGCDDGTGPGTDGGGGMDGTVTPPDGSPPPRDGGDGGGAGADGDVCVPTIEICGDRIDQNCDGRDTSCGDGDGDGIEACRAGDDLTMCDCDDSRADVRPPFGTVPGGAELCDGVDNDCNGRIDEAAECCAGCAGIDPSRADICNTEGVCVCTTGSGTGPCPEGQTCCSSGCVDAQTDFNNCGFCNTMCTPSADRCVAGVCRCGTGPVCDLDYLCSGGSC